MSANICFAQYKMANDIVVMYKGNQLKNPFVGGLNTPQFSEIDLNQDGIQDLFVFDRSGYKVITYINTGEPGEINYLYAPQYESIFPELQEWAMIRDFNCDNVPDIFSYYIGSASVYKGSISGGNLSFNLFKNKIYYLNGFLIPVYTVSTDISTFDDINGDGDIDVLSFSTSGTTIRYYENTSQESGFGCDSLNYELTEYCWGLINEGNVCHGADLNIACKGGSADDETTNKMLHSGSTMLTIDKDNDGDKDLILGDVSCDNLVFYRNGGDNFFAQMSSKDTLFPSNTTASVFPTFDAPFSIDVDNDGAKDLLVAPNDNEFGLNKDNTWYYKNINTNDTADFIFENDTLFSSEMIDEGSYSKPVFFDYNADGLKDIVIGKKFAYGNDEIKKYGLSLYENTGTATTPAYTFITNDFANLAFYNLIFFQPCFGDLDGDGDEDMIIGNADGTLFYCQNTAPIGMPAVFAAPIVNYQAIDVGLNAAPTLIDIDKDNKLDLVIGEQNGNLNYYHNTGTVTSPVFTFIADNWGGVDVRKSGYLTGFSTPFLYRNAADSLILLVGSQSGYIFEFNDIEESLEGEFFQQDTFFLKYNPGLFSTISGAEINGDGRLDFLTGNIRGGLNIFTEKGANTVTTHSNANSLHIFPNPSDDMISIFSEALNDAELSSILVYTMEGKKVYSDVMHSSNKRLVISIKELPSGIYTLSILSQGKYSIAKFVKQ